MNFDHLNFDQARDAFDNDDADGMEKYAAELNDLFLTSIWNSDTENLLDLLKKSARLRELVHNRNNITLGREYYWGFLWGIESLTRNVMLYKKEFSDVDNAVKKAKNLDGILGYLYDRKTVQHKDLAGYLKISPSALTNFMLKHDPERLNLLITSRIGRTTWYSITKFGEEYVKGKRTKQESEVTALKGYIEQLINKITESSVEPEGFVENYRFASTDTQEDLARFMFSKIKEANGLLQLKEKIGCKVIDIETKRHNKGIYSDIKNKNLIENCTETQYSMLVGG